VHVVEIQSLVSACWLESRIEQRNPDTRAFDPIAPRERVAVTMRDYRGIESKPRHFACEIELIKPDWPTASFNLEPGMVNAPCTIAAPRDATVAAAIHGAIVHISHGIVKLAVFDWVWRQVRARRANFDDFTRAGLD
jgi:hypothetical protein